MKEKFSTFTVEQKKEAAQICKIIVELSTKARREGIRALESDMDGLFADGNKDKRFMFALLRLLVDGQNLELIEEIADNFADSSASDDFERFVFAVVKRGVHAISLGENPHVLARVFLSYVGFDDEDWFCCETGFGHWNTDI